MNESIKDLISFRDFNPKDEGFIYSTWLKGLYFGSEFFKQIPELLFYKNYNKVITGILNYPTTRVVVACFKDDPDLILGYIVYDRRVLHWVHVKEAWRKLGIYTNLLPQGIREATHMTKVYHSLKPRGVIFNPFSIRTVNPYELEEKLNKTHKNDQFKPQTGEKENGS